MNCQDSLIRRISKIVAAIEKMLLSAAYCNKDIVIPGVVQETYQSDIQIETLKAQLKLIPDLIVRHKDLAGVTIKKVTSI